MLYEGVREVADRLGHRDPPAGRRARPPLGAAGLRLPIRPDTRPRLLGRRSGSGRTLGASAAGSQTATSARAACGRPSPRRTGTPCTSARPSASLDRAHASASMTLADANEAPQPPSSPVGEMATIWVESSGFRLGVVATTDFRASDVALVGEPAQREVAPDRRQVEGAEPLGEGDRERSRLVDANRDQAGGECGLRGADPAWHGNEAR